jgi:hypothetical protein
VRRAGSDVFINIPKLFVGEMLRVSLRRAVSGRRSGTSRLLCDCVRQPPIDAATCAHLRSPACPSGVVLITSAHPVHAPQELVTAR